MVFHNCHRWLPAVPGAVADAPLSRQDVYNAFQDETLGCEFIAFEPVLPSVSSRCLPQLPKSVFLQEPSAHCPEGWKRIRQAPLVGKKCQAAHVNSAGNVASPESIRDRADAYRSHLKRCPYHRPEVVATTLPAISSNSDEAGSFCDGKFEQFIGKVACARERGRLCNVLGNLGFIMLYSWYGKGNRLIGIIRNEVRERNRRESDFGECRRQKKPVDPAERPNQQMHGVSNLATSLFALADVTDVDYMETVGAVTFRWTPSSI
ncbi:uncharacterized protein PITG_18387 [Phytophthora infestans T30-4]|uniref:Uncharacterized protein n=1 Tax=Phytophthora infestans (strain T30-4) TaxID=403677 RepID=D0NY20_PHYIT|nr:uncharacterized protein PITG_18387 [Phytophthora infestans T30-4]EEY67971.1 conserved hypothetical protein [Phytophthora infestans T30-4]|eukprot:XP_002997833.1 conserved hypothetical protein [Phytophthora infestans T30-4]